MKTALDLPSKNDDFLDRQLLHKADLDYIPGLDYDLGPVFMPSKFGVGERISFHFLLRQAALDESPEAAKARAEEAARKKAAALAAELEAKKKEEATRLIKPILPASSLFIFSSTNP